MCLQAPAPNWAAEYTARLHGPTIPASGQPVSLAEAEAAYNAGLNAAAARAQHSVSAQNRKRRDQLRSELSSFLAALPYGRTLQTCTPEDLLVYLELVYIPNHAGSQLTDGSIHAAPATISNVLSHLRVILKEAGRGTFWDPLKQQGNAANAYQLSSWRQGHEKLTHARGFRQTSAKIMPEDKFLQLQSHIFQAAFLSPGRAAHDRAVLARDGFAFCLLWQTGMRGINASTVQLDDFRLPGQGRGSIRAYLQSEHPVQMQPPGIIEVQLVSTKTQLDNQDTISIQPSSDQLQDLWFWLLAVYTHAALASQPIIQYLVRPSEAGPSQSNPTAQGSNSRIFPEQPLSTSGLRGRVKHHLSSIGAYSKEAMHSFRRSMAHRSQAAGEPSSVTMQRMLLRSEKIFLHTYAAAGRQDTGIKRVRPGTIPASTSRRPASQAAPQVSCVQMPILS